MNLNIHGYGTHKFFLENSLPLEKVGLSNQEYNKLLKEAVMPRPIKLEDKAGLTISEAVWFEIARELQASGYQKGIIAFFTGVIMMRVEKFHNDSDLLEDNVVYTSVEIQPRIAFSCYVLDLFLCQFLEDKKDVEFQFNRQGQFRIISFGDNLNPEEKPMKGPVVSFRLSQLLSTLLGESNVPEVAKLFTPITYAEAEVLKSLRMSQYLTVSVEKAPPGARYTWDVVTREVGIVGAGEAKSMCDNLPKGYNKFILNGQNSREMPYDLFRRKRCQ